MNLIQNLLYRTYPLRMKISRRLSPAVIIENFENKKPAVSFYSLKATLNTGEEIEFSRYKGKRILIVNVASNCGYTAQCEQLQTIYTLEPNLIVLAFPANNFGKQEPGSNDKIGAFCRKNFGVTFPVFLKNDVTGPGKQAVFQWLSHKSRNGWNDRGPRWNFFKYLIDETGTLVKVAPSKVTPADLIR